MIGTYAAAVAIWPPRWRSARRRSRSAGSAAAPGWRRRWGWRWSSRSAGGRCGCRARHPLGARPRARLPRLARLPAGTAGGRGEAWRAAWPVALIALAGASLPFAVEGHFGILGTSFNPDMSQHLLAAARLAEGSGSQLLHQGYPLGPHAVVVALNKGLGVGLVQGFSGLTVAVAGARAADRAGGLRGSAAAAAQRRRAARRARLRPRLLLRPGRLQGDARGALRPRLRAGAARVDPARLARAAAALRAGGADRGRRRLRVQLPRPALAARDRRALGPARPLRAPARTAPPGAARGARPARLRRAGDRPHDRLPPLRNLRPERPRPRQPVRPDLAASRRSGSGPPATSGSPPATAPCRRSATTSAPPSASSCSPTASADAGAGASARSSPPSAPAALAYAAARIGGTAYTAAKAIEIAAPLAALTILLPLCRRAFPRFGSWRGGGGPRGAGARRIRAARPPPRQGPRSPASSLCLFALAAGACALLALANAPVGPSSYSPALTGLRPLLAEDPTLVLASPQLLADEHGTPYIAWELRGGRVCIAAAEEAGELPRGRALRRHRRRRRQAALPGPAPASRSHRPTCSGKRPGPSGPTVPAP